MISRLAELNCMSNYSEIFSGDNSPTAHAPGSAPKEASCPPTDASATTAARREGNETKSAAKDKTASNLKLAQDAVEVCFQGLYTAQITIIVCKTVPHVLTNF